MYRKKTSMFMQVQPLRLPSQPINGFSVEMPSFGGGYIVRLSIGGQIETLVFADSENLTRYLQIMLSGQALAQGAQAAAEAPKPDALGEMGVSAPKTSPVRKGRPRLSDEEKAANRARRAAMKANGVGHGEQDSNAATAEASETVTA